MSEKADIIVVHHPWTVCEKILEHGADERPDVRVHLAPFWKLSYSEKKVDQWAR